MNEQNNGTHIQQRQKNKSNNNQHKGSKEAALVCSWCGNVAPFGRQAKSFFFLFNGNESTKYAARSLAYTRSLSLPQRGVTDIQ